MQILLPLNLPKPGFKGLSNPSIKERFESFHDLNPHVYDALRELALRARGAGRTHYGIKSLFEVLRWSYLIQTQGDEFKLNNNYHAHYARLLMTEEPDLEGFFELREKQRGSS